MKFNSLFKSVLFGMVFSWAGMGIAIAEPLNKAAQKNNESGLMNCSCTESSCGRNAIGGDQGDVFTNIAPGNVKARFQTNPTTGWTCVAPAMTRGVGGPKACFCKGSCGSGGVGADPNYFDLGLSPEIVAQSYGGGIPGNQTGWLCGNYRGDFK